ncbi:neocarzinostatin apoprotein domain-containing protein [Nocardia alba]|uniref:Neocarzinostatin family protein n=1 Tax=Nocardia alba TaxID=225051 RepID=A0A4R1FWP0_9NOCA|nr:neocarzinostatin apoprotein domain-containing protein [Nocardia alba]TCJ97118.1 neocarzinostatin family protein [Nocardia alba]
MIRTVLTATAAAAVLATIAAPPALAAPGATVEVSASSGVSELQRITVNGSGFQPGLSAVAVGLCKQNFVSGIKDCDLEGGATFVNIGADGTFPTVTLTARARFNAIDCATQQCVIAAAPLPGAEPPAVRAANSAEVAVTFAGSALSPRSTPVPGSTVATERDIQGPSIVLWGITAALLLLVAAVTLIGRRRL